MADKRLDVTTPDGTTTRHPDSREDGKVHWRRRADGGLSVFGIQETKAIPRVGRGAQRLEKPIAEYPPGSLITGAGTFDAASREVR